MAMVDWQGDIIEPRYRERGLLPEEADNLGSELAEVRNKNESGMSNNEEPSSVFTIQAASLIDEGLRESAPITWEERQLNAERFTASENYDCSSSVIDPILNQSTFVSRIAELNVHNNCVERLNQISGENSNVSEDNGLGFFIDFDDLFEISGVSGKSKPGVTAKHLSKIWRIDESTAEQTIDVTSQLLKQEATDQMPRNFGTNDRML